MTIPALLCIDEPDEFHLPDRPDGDWHGFLCLVDRMQELREVLAASSGRPATCSWFLRLDPQIEEAYGSASWAVDRYAPLLERLIGEGDELAVHPHGWRLDDRGWFHDHGDVAWVEHCTGVAVRTFEEAFGRAPFSHRGGDRFISPATVAVLEAAGVAVDLTLEPGALAATNLVPGGRSTGEVPSIPSSLRHPFLGGLERLWDGAPDVPSGGLLFAPLLSAVDPSEGPIEHPRTTTLSLTFPTRTFRVLLEHRLRQGDLRHLAFAVRSDIGVDPLVLQRTDENLRHVATRLGTAIEWTTPEGAFARLRGAAVTPRTSAAVDDGPRTDAGQLFVGLQQAVDDAERSIVALSREVEEREAALAARRDLAQAVALELERLRVEVGDQARQAASLHQNLHDVSTELHRIQPYVARAEELEAELAAIRATRWWRLHERFHAPLAALARRRPAQ